MDVYTTGNGTNMEKYLTDFMDKQKNADSDEQKTPFQPFLASRAGSVPSFDEKNGRHPLKNGYQSGYSRTDTITDSINKNWRIFLKMKI